MARGDIAGPSSHAEEGESNAYRWRSKTRALLELEEAELLGSLWNTALYLFVPVVGAIS
jgi:hypothetical protein